MTYKYSSSIAVIIGLSCLSFTFSCKAENHALIMWIAEYADPQANLKGIDLDAEQARSIATIMGVPKQNIVEMRNGELTLQGMSQALKALTGRIAVGDNVFIYYSGHGKQITAQNKAGKKCSEGIATQDLRLYVDQALESGLALLAAKARQVVMMNDSCFSGGASEKKLGELWGAMPKALPVPLIGVASNSDLGRECGDATNKALFSKNFEVVPSKGTQMLYIAAARDDEVSWATSNGSLATQAWGACLKASSTDTDQSGSVSGEELRECSQALINKNPTKKRQTITLTGTAALPVSFAVGNGPVNAQKTLEDIGAGADLSGKVSLTPTKVSLRIGQDDLAFKVETDRPGYLYILQVGSDGKSFNLLFPNNLDKNNHLPQGIHNFPRPSWRITAGGPVGTSYLMAVVSSKPKNFAQEMNRSGPFATVEATQNGAKNLIISATGAGRVHSGRYSASKIVSLGEVQ